MQKRTFIKSLAAVTALSAIVLLTGCDEEKAVAEKPFRVGVTAGPHAAIVTEAAKVAAKNGLKVEVVEFTDYVTPDTALNDGALDAAVYQHEPFLLNFNKQKGTKLANVGNAVVQPMGFYSNKVKSVADIPEGAVISVRTIRRTADAVFSSCRPRASSSFPKAWAARPLSPTSSRTSAT